MTTEQEVREWLRQKRHEEEPCNDENHADEYCMKCGQFTGRTSRVGLVMYGFLAGSGIVVAAILLGFWMRGIP